MAIKKEQLHNLTYRCRSASLAPSAGSYNPPSTGTGIAPGALFSKVTGLTICFTDTFRISSVDKKVKSTLVTSEATGFEIFMVGVGCGVWWWWGGGLGGGGG